MFKLIKWLCMGIGALVISVFLLGMCDSLLEDEDGTSETDFENADFRSMDKEDFIDYVAKLDELSESEIDRIIGSFSQSQFKAFMNQYEKYIENGDDDTSESYYEDDDDDDEYAYVDDDDDDEDEEGDDDDDEVSSYDDQNSGYEPDQTIPGEKGKTNNDYSDGATGYDAAMKAYKNKDAEKAIALFEECKTGEAYHMIAEIYRNGLGSVKKNAIRALMYDKKAKEAGYK